MAEVEVGEALMAAAASVVRMRYSARAEHADQNYMNIAFNALQTEYTRYNGRSSLLAKEA